MVENKYIVEQLRKIHKIINGLQNIDVKIEDDDKTIVLLSLLPRSFKHFKYTLLYGIEGTITLDELQTTIRSKELSKLKDFKLNDNGECLTVSRERSENKENHKRKRSK